MQKITEQIKAQAKELILARVSYSKAATKLQVDPLQLYNALCRDHDIVAAKAAGRLNPAKNTTKRTDYTNQPWVIDVMHNGMSQMAAAAKHGKSQAFISQCLRKAKEQLAQRGTSAEPAPPPPPQPPTDPDLQAITLLISSYAARHNLSTKQVLHLLDK